jgi:hypothetical protein
VRQLPPLSTWEVLPQGSAGLAPPTPEDWDGPVHGELGVLATDGTRVQCHVCAAWFVQLGHHVVRTHGLPADAHKAYFGLRASTGLVGPLIREAQQRLKAERDLAPHRDEGPKALRRLTSEQRAQNARGRRLPVESRRDPAIQAQWRRAGQRIHEKYLAGSWSPPTPRLDPHELGRRAQASFRERLRDPAFKAHWTEALSRARGGRVTRQCQTCGRPFRIEPFRVRLGEGKYCSRACVPSPATRAEVRAKISAAARQRGRGAGAALRAPGSGPGGVVAGTGP